MAKTGIPETSTPAAAAVTSPTAAPEAASTAAGTAAAKPQSNLCSLFFKIQDALKDRDGNNKNQKKCFDNGSTNSNIILDRSCEDFRRAHSRAALAVKKAPPSSQGFQSQLQRLMGPSSTNNGGNLVTNHSKNTKSPFRPLTWDTPSFVPDLSSNPGRKKRSLEESEKTSADNIIRSRSKYASSAPDCSSVDDSRGCVSLSETPGYGTEFYPRNQISEEGKRKLLELTRKIILKDGMKRQKFSRED